MFKEEQSVREEAMVEVGKKKDKRLHRGKHGLLLPSLSVIEKKTRQWDF